MFHPHLCVREIPPSFPLSCYLGKEGGGDTHPRALRGMAFQRRVHLDRSLKGKARIAAIKRWIETLTTEDHHHCFSEPLFAHEEEDSKDVCDLCSLPNDELIRNCYNCDRRLGKTCGCAATNSKGGGAEEAWITCAVCRHIETFFVVCSCGVDECYNYWGINPKLETYYRCKRHHNPLADRCVPRVKCSTCRNKVAFPYCAQCPLSHS